MRINSDVLLMMGLLLTPGNALVVPASRATTQFDVNILDTRPSSKLNQLIERQFPQKRRSNYIRPSILGPDNVPLDEENPDLITPPSTDQGEVPNLKWPFSLSHNRLSEAGWARQQNSES